MKQVLFITAMAVFMAVGLTSSSFAQSSCQCSNSICSASQGCPSGYIAVCTCSATGCGSVCNKQDGQNPEGFSEMALDATLRNQPVEMYGKLLSKALGREVLFTPNESKFKYDYAVTKALSASHWEVLEYLAKNGTLKINGQDLVFWKGMRQTLLKGGDISFCTSNAPADMILSQIVFLSGKRYAINSGNPKTIINGAVSGKSLDEILANLTRMSGTTIAAN